MKKTSAILVLLAMEVFAGGYRNELTGSFFESDWCTPDGGLTARLCVNNKRIALGQMTPIFLVEVQNVSSKTIAINDIFYTNMLLVITPQKVQYTSDDLEWVFDHDRLREPLKPGECVRAICKVPHRLVPSAGEYRFSLDIERGMRTVKGGPLRGDDWWTGRLRPAPVVVEYR